MTLQRLKIEVLNCGEGMVCGEKPAFHKKVLKSKRMKNGSTGRSLKGQWGQIYRLIQLSMEPSIQTSVLEILCAQTFLNSPF
jgi:hypothetical protein